MLEKKIKSRTRKAKAVKNKAETERKQPQAKSFSKSLIVKDIMLEAKVLGISVGAAEQYAEKVSNKVVKWAERREAVTENDINAEIAKEINKYSKDLSFVYKNRGKII